MPAFEIILPSYRAISLSSTLRPPTTRSRRGSLTCGKLRPAGRHSERRGRSLPTPFLLKALCPPSSGISVVTTGIADVVGPDVRSAPIDAGSVTGKGPVRIEIEIVLIPEMSIDAAVLSQLVASAFPPATEHVSVGGGLTAADVSVLTADAVLMSANGQIEIQGQPGVTDRLAFTGKATLSLVPSAAPAPVDVFDLITIGRPYHRCIRRRGLMSALLPAVRGFLSRLLADQLR